MVHTSLLFALLVAVCPASASISTRNRLNPSLPYDVSNPAEQGRKDWDFRGEYFDVVSQTLRMRYAEVVWRTLPPVALPEDVVQRFANSTMAVTGFEVDVRRKDSVTGEETSVPAYQSYNHHYGVMLMSSAAALKMGPDGTPLGHENGHGKILELEYREETVAPEGARLAQSFIHGNGQEHRQIYHGTPLGYAQPIFAPSHFVLTPMQISTNDGTGRTAAGGTTRMNISVVDGTINGNPYFADCKGAPTSDLLDAHNPTCELATYVGGLSCCPDKSILLDADQEPPAFVDEIFFKFRFFFEEYHASRHRAIEHVEWSQNGCDSGSGGPNAHGCHHIEFDVVRGVGSEAGPDIQTFTSTFKAEGMLATSCSPTAGQCMDGSKVGDEGIELIMAASHCHAPNCVGQDLLNVDTGEAICTTVPIFGTSEVGASMNEPGYIFTPPCLWGSAEEGLHPPPKLFKNTTLRMVTRFNSTYSHTGQMGIWQMKAAYGKSATRHQRR